MLTVRAEDGATYSGVSGVRIERGIYDNASSRYIYRLQVFVGGVHVTIMSCQGGSGIPSGLAAEQEKIGDLLCEKAEVVDYRNPEVTEPIQRKTQ